MLNIKIKTGNEQMDVELIHRFLNENSYWARGIPYAMVENSLEHSYCVGAFLDGNQIGFGRVITDYNTFAWFADFFVLPEFQGKGIAKQILRHILEQPWAGGLRRIMLNTRDAHSLYRQFDFRAPKNPDGLMELVRLGLYGS